jgi:hypothetical protein
MTLSLAFSTFGSFHAGNYDYSEMSSNAKELMIKIGMDEKSIEKNIDFTIKPTNDSVGVIAGNMPINVNNENVTLVAIAIRGVGYEREWASNFTLGVSGQHKGFSEGKDKVITFMREYFKSQNISGKVKFWLTGFSRGAAVANLVAGAIDNGIIIDNDIIYNTDDVYAYCFGTPAGALTDELEGTSRYENIFNIINPNDIVPFVAPFEMGFGRYGVDMLIPTAESNPGQYEKLKENMLDFYYQLEGVTTYTVDEFQMKKLGAKNWLPGGEPIEFIVDDNVNDYSQNVFLSKYISILSKEFFISRQNYVSNYEKEVREICSVIFGCTFEQQKILLDSFIAQVQSNWGMLAWSYVWNAGINPWGEEADALQMISDWLKKAINDAGITDYDEAVIDSAGIALGDLMLALVTSHPNYFTTAVMNVQRLGEAHFPELYLAWMKSLDENYTQDVEYTLNSNAYRIVFIDGEAEFEAYTSDGKVVASYKDGKFDNIESGNSFGTDENGRYIVFPVDKEYNIIITSDDSFNYIVKEYNESVGYTRIVEYNDVYSDNDLIIIGNIPMYSDEEIQSGAPYGSKVNYTLRYSNGEEIEKDFEISKNEEFYISAVSENEEFGTVSGGDLYKYGQTAILCAEATDGYTFAGWYENGNLVSTDAIYSVKVYENRNFVGRFVSLELTPKAGNGVTVLNGKIYGMWDLLTAERAKELFENSDAIIVDTENFVGSGTKFTYYNKEYVAVITGDVDGDGEISSTDYMRIKSLFIGDYLLDGVYFEAADVDGDGDITTTDYLRIKSYFLGAYEIYHNKVA